MSDKNLHEIRRSESCPPPSLKRTSSFAGKEILSKKGKPSFKAKPEFSESSDVLKERGTGSLGYNEKTGKLEEKKRVISPAFIKGGRTAAKAKGDLNAVHRKQTNGEWIKAGPNEVKKRVTNQTSLKSRQTTTEQKFNAVHEKGSNSEWKNVGLSRKEKGWK
jgi:hypothetical protein